MTQKVLKIRYLADVPQHIPLLAQWTVQTWGQYDPTLTLERAQESLARKLSYTIPLTAVAIMDTEVVGMVSLKSQIRVEQAPPHHCWVGSLFVVSAWRGHGVGKRLLNFVYACAAIEGWKELYLYVSDHSMLPWYEKLGWERGGLLPFHQHQVQLMRIDIASGIAKSNL